MKKVRPSQRWGIWVRKDRKFYWLETGPVFVQHTQDKLISMLVSRDILEYQAEHRLVRNQEPYLQMTLQDAQDKNYEVVQLFLNDHVKEIVTTRENEQSKNESPW